jgi:hypothetical protein
LTAGCKSFNDYILWDNIISLLTPTTSQILTSGLTRK